MNVPREKNTMAHVKQYNNFTSRKKRMVKTMNKHDFLIDYQKSVSLELMGYVAMYSFDYDVGMIDVYRNVINHISELLNNCGDSESEIYTALVGVQKVCFDNRDALSRNNRNDCTYGKCQAYLTMARMLNKMICTLDH